MAELPPVVRETDFEAGDLDDKSERPNLESNGER